MWGRNRSGLEEARPPGRMISRRDALVAGVAAVTGATGGAAWARQNDGGGDDNAQGQRVVGAASLFVAAADAPDRLRNAADYVCKGKNDDAIINAAIDACGSSGGKVVLSSGTFVVSGAIRVKSAITIEGAGRSTQIAAAGKWAAGDGSSPGGVVELYDGATHSTSVRHLTIHGGKFAA